MHETERLTPYVVKIGGADVQRRRRAKAGRDIEGDDYSTDIFGSAWTATSRTWKNRYLRNRVSTGTGSRS